MLDRSERLVPWMLLGLVFFAWLPPLGLHDYWFPDEPDVALPIIEMLRRGDWIVPTHIGSAWLDYPPLTYWGGLLWSSLLGGATPWTLRLTPLLAGAVFLYATGAIARQLAGDAAARWAMILGIATPLVWMQATTLQVDMAFAASQAAGYALYLAAENRSGRAAGGFRIGAFACFGAAILAKGPLGLLLPGLILTIWHAWNRQWTRILWLAPLALVALAVAALWYVPLIHRLGLPYVLQEFWLQNFDRFGTTTRGHGGKGPAYYLMGLWGDLGPWTLLLPPAVLLWWRERSVPQSRLTGLWFLISLVFLSAASTKRTVYLLPAYPAILVLLGTWLAARRELRWLAACTAITGGLFALAAVGFSAWHWTPIAQMRQVHALGAALNVPTTLLTLVFAAGAWGAFVALRRREPTRAAMNLAVTLAVAFTVAQWTLLPAIDRVHNYREPAAWIAEHSAPGEAVGFFAPERQALKHAGWLCYLGARGMLFFGDLQSAKAWLLARPGRLLIVDPSSSPPVAGSAVENGWVIGEQDWLVLGRH